MAMELREAGIKTELFNEPKKLDKQMKYANKKGFNFVITNGSNEFENQKVKIKNMVSGEVFESTFDNFVQVIEVAILRENKGDPTQINLKILELLIKRKEEFEQKQQSDNQRNQNNIFHQEFIASSFSDILAEIMKEKLTVS
jgi:hypothetical protein